MPTLEELAEWYGPVEEVVVDDDYLEHQRRRGHYARHRVRGWEVLDAFDIAPMFLDNTADPDHPHRAPVLMLGRTRADRILAVPIEPTRRWGVWRAVTAFEANAEHQAIYLSS